MKFLKQNWLVISIFLLVSLLVLIRTFSHKNFRYDAVKWAAPSALGTNILTEDQIPALSGDKLLINLGNKATSNQQFRDITLDMNPESLLEKTNLKLILQGIKVRLFCILTKAPYQPGYGWFSVRWV